MSEIPEDCDWVKVRNEWSLDSAFKQLETEAKANVERRTEAIDNGRDEFGFKFTSRGHTFYVERLQNRAGRSVSFTLIAEGISIDDVISGDRLYLATVCVNDLGQRRFKVNNRELTYWQVLRMALEPVLFDFKKA